MAAHPSVESAEGLSKHRIEALSDGIFAFAMTLLVLDIKMRYATTHHRLVGRGLEPEVIRRGALRPLGGAAMYLCAILLAPLNPMLSLIIYAAIPLVYILPGPLDHHWTHLHG